MRSSTQHQEPTSPGKGVQSNPPADPTAIRRTAWLRDGGRRTWTHPDDSRRCAVLSMVASKKKLRDVKNNFMEAVEALARLDGELELKKTNSERGSNRIQAILITPSIMDAYRPSAPTLLKVCANNRNPYGDH